MASASRPLALWLVTVALLIALVVDGRPSLAEIFGALELGLTSIVVLLFAALWLALVAVVAALHDDAAGLERTVLAMWNQHPVLGGDLSPTFRLLRRLAVQSILLREAIPALARRRPMPLVGLFAYLAFAGPVFARGFWLAIGFQFRWSDMSMPLSYLASQAIAIVVTLAFASQVAEGGPALRLPRLALLALVHVPAGVIWAGWLSGYMLSDTVVSLIPKLRGLLDLYLLLALLEATATRR